MELTLLDSTRPDKRRRSFLKLASVLLHVVIVAALIFPLHKAVKAHQRRRAQRLTPYAPGRSAAAPQPPKPKIIPPKDEPKLAMKPPDPPPSAGDPTGEADVTLAVADFFPDPKPDLSALPRGTKGDVIVDVVIDEEGNVVDTRLDQGLGHGLDEAVMAILQTWTFYPATKAGKPVASEQQLLFHFERT